jgi:hypothetical protein
MRTRLFAIAALVAVVLLSPIGNVEACGPFFEDDVFVSTTSPDDIASFARGQLGILQAGYDSNEYAVAYRYLNGGSLSDAERQAYAPSTSPRTVLDWRNMTPAEISAAQQAERQAQENAQPFGQWLRERAKYIPKALLENRSQSSPPTTTAPSPSTRAISTAPIPHSKMQCSR